MGRYRFIQRWHNPIYLKFRFQLEPHSGIELEVKRDKMFKITWKLFWVWTFNISVSGNVKCCIHVIRYHLWTILNRLKIIQPCDFFDPEKLQRIQVIPLAESSKCKQNSLDLRGITWMRCNFSGSKKSHGCIIFNRFKIVQRWYPMTWMQRLTWPETEMLKV